MRLIDADVFWKAFLASCPRYTEVVELVKRVVADQPPVDAEKVLRCRSCRYYNSKQICELYGTDKDKDGFCDEAVRRYV